MIMPLGCIGCTQEASIELEETEFKMRVFTGPGMSSSVVMLTDALVAAPIPAVVRGDTCGKEYIKKQSF